MRVCIYIYHDTYAKMQISSYNLNMTRIAYFQHISCMLVHISGCIVHIFACICIHHACFFRFFLHILAYNIIYLHIWYCRMHMPAYSCILDAYVCIYSAYVCICLHISAKYVMHVFANALHMSAYACICLLMSLMRPSFFLYSRAIRKNPSHWPGGQWALRLYSSYNLCPCASPHLWLKFFSLPKFTFSLHQFRV